MVIYKYKNMSTELNLKEQAFVSEYLLNGCNGKRAYMKAYENDNENSSAVEAHKLLKKEKIKRALDEEEGGFKELAREYGADKKAIVKKLYHLIFEPVEIVQKDKNGKLNKIEVDRDGKEIIQAINTLAKLTGDFAPEKKEIKLDEEKSPIDTKNLTPEELDELKKDLLSNM
jgi:hypothetical protein